MKNKLKIIDINIVSSYMGRSLTGLVTVLVLGLTLSALSGGGGIFGDRLINVCVPSDGPDGASLEKYEPFKTLLSFQTRRPVSLSLCSDEGPDGFDLYIVPIYEFFLKERELEITPLFTWKRASGRDSVVVIGRGRARNQGYSDVSPAEVAFSDPLSINGFWIPFLLLREKGLSAPDKLSGLRFEGGSGDYSRIIFGVIYGSYKLGACRKSDLASFEDKGLIGKGEVEIVEKDEVLPEIVIASKRDEAAYYARKLEGVSRLFGESPPSHQKNAVGLLKSFGIEGLSPIEARQIENARELFVFFQEHF